MTWNELLSKNQVEQHRTSLSELRDLRAVVARDLEDASITGLSADRRFATAYNAVLQLSKMVIACAGYKVKGMGHHHTSFVALKLAMGPLSGAYAAYFDSCRRKRNIVDYDMAGAASESEADELLLRATEFEEKVEAWIAANFPEFRA